MVAMGPNSEPEAGFDPVYGWGAGEHVHEPLIQSTLTVTGKDLEIGWQLQWMRVRTGCFGRWKSGMTSGFRTGKS